MYIFGNSKLAWIMISGFLLVVITSIFLLFIYSQSGNLWEPLVQDSFIGQSKIGCSLMRGRWVQLVAIPEVGYAYGCVY